VIGLFLDGCSQ